MKHEIVYPGPTCMLRVKMEHGECLKAEAGSMIAMSDTFVVEGKMEGGILGGLGRMFTGESFFFQTINAANGPGEVLIAHELPGDIYAIELDGRMGWTLQKEGFLAGGPDVTVTTTMQNLTKGLFSGEGFFVIKIGGQGPLFVSSYGAIHPIDLADRQEVIIDNAHIVAWQDTVTYNIQKASKGWISSWTSGEGLVCKFRGPGRVLIQSRNPPAFGSWLRKFIPTKG